MSTSRPKLVVKRFTRSSDGQGGFVAGAPSTVATYRGRIARARASERRIASQESAEITHYVILPGSANVRREDTIEQLGASYEVKDVYATRGIPRKMQVYLKSVQVGV